MKKRARYISQLQSKLYTVERIRAQRVVLTPFPDGAHVGGNDGEYRVIVVHRVLLQHPEDPQGQASKEVSVTRTKVGANDWSAGHSPCAQFHTPPLT